MKQKDSKQVGVARWGKVIFISGGILLFLRYFIFIPVDVIGDSMSPTLEPDSRVLYEPYSSIERFDIVLFYDSEGQAYLKRVIGLPGETLAYQDDQLYINGSQVEETYLSHFLNQNQLLTPDFNLEQTTGNQMIPEGKYFVLGDNRTRSKDSRMYGFVSEQAIQGKVKVVIFPFEAFAILP